jgi:hypothetical protein
MILLKIGSPAILGSFVALERRGGSEDPWLCVTSFSWFCLYQLTSVLQLRNMRQFWDVLSAATRNNRGRMSAKGHQQKL